MTASLATMQPNGVSCGGCPELGVTSAMASPKFRVRPVAASSQRWLTTHRPMRAHRDLRHDAPADPETRCEFLVPSERLRFDHLANAHRPLVLSRISLRGMRGATVGVGATLGPHVADVVLRGAEEQMVRSHAHAVVAVMANEHAGRDGANHE